MSEITKVSIDNLTDEEREYLLTAPYSSALRSLFEMFLGNRMGVAEYQYLVCWLADKHNEKKERQND